MARWCLDFLVIIDPLSPQDCLTSWCKNLVQNKKVEVQVEMKQKKVPQHNEFNVIHGPVTNEKNLEELVCGWNRMIYSILIDTCMEEENLSFEVHLLL